MNQLNERSVLVVEDEPIANKTLCIILGRKGMKTDSASCIAQALSKIAASPPDLILLDLMLPDGEGTDILAHVRKEKLSSKVIVTTGSTDPERMKRLDLLRPDYFIRKPIDCLELLNVIDYICLS